MPQLRLCLLALALPCLVCTHPAPRLVPPALPSPAPLATEPVPPSLRHPRTGEIRPEVGAPLEVELEARSLDPQCETLLLRSREPVGQAVVFVETAGPRPWSGANAAGALVIRRAAAEAGQPLRGRVFEPAYRGRPGLVHAFELPTTTSVTPDGRAQQAWVEALTSYLGSRRSPWHAFAAHRLAQAFSAEPAPDTRARPQRRGALVAQPRRNPSDVARLMETTTGMTSIQEALQTERRLLVTEGEKANVDLSSLKAPPLAEHPWTAMLAALHAEAPDEPLAAATPADFYFVRFHAFEHLMQMLDRLDAWITPATNLLSDVAEDRGLSARYETELGLGRSALARVLGPSVISDVAVVGSDPYVREGSDLTFIFRAKSKAAFELALASALAGHGSQHGGLQTNRLEYEGTSIDVALSPDGSVRQHRASVKGLEIVSNSPTAIRRVVATLVGRQPCLADEPDFRYMMARDRAVRADVLAFMGDRFIANVAGPRQRILEARRQMELARLSTPGYAALLYGWIYGRPPAGVEELRASRLLRPEELVHASGEAIQWSPQQGARSIWGTPAALTPLIDLETPRLVTPLERDAYAEFVRGYQEYWRRYLDPAAVRVALDRKSMQVDLRVLPLIDASEYRDLEKAVGHARTLPGQASPGVRTVLGIGENADVRHQAARLVRGLPGGGRFDLDWLGVWALLGMDDNARAAELALAEANSGNPGLRQRPLRPDEARPRHQRLRESDLADLPVYAGLDLRSPTAAVMFLAGWRKILEDAAPGMIDWREAGRERDVPFVTVRATGQASEDLGTLAVHYAFCKQAFLASLNEATLRARIDDCVEGRLPTGAQEGKPGSAQAPQWIVDLSLAPQGPFWYLAAWLLDATGREVDERSQDMAEILWRGVPRAQAAEVRGLALRTLGMVPVSFDGRELTLGPEGVTDPVRGSAHAPRWPQLPVPGSPVARLLEAVGQARSEVSFDEEPRVGEHPMRGLHVRLTLTH